MYVGSFSFGHKAEFFIFNNVAVKAIYELQLVWYQNLFSDTVLITTYFRTSITVLIIFSSIFYQKYLEIFFLTALITYYATEMFDC